MPGEISIAFRYAEDTTLREESEELKSLLMKVKEESGKVGLKLKHSENEDHGIWCHHFMANRWENNGNNDRLFSWALKSLQMVTAAMKLKDTSSLEEKLDSILKSRDITLLTKVHTVKSKVSQDLRMDMRVGP